MKYLKKFESSNSRKHNEVILDNGVKVYLTENLTKFTEEDVLDFYNDFEIISSAFDLNLVESIDPDKRLNQFEIGVAANLYVEVIYFDDSEDLKETMDDFIDSIKRKYNWSLPTKNSYSYNFSENVDNSEFVLINIVFTKNNEVKQIVKKSEPESIDDLFTDKYDNSTKIEILSKLESNLKLKEIVEKNYPEFINEGELMTIKLLKKLNII